MAQNRQPLKIGVLGYLLVFGLAVVPLLTGSPASMAYAWSFLQMLALVLSLNLITGFTGYVNFGHIAFYGVGAYAVAYLTTTTRIDPYLFIPFAAIVPAAIAYAIGRPLLSIRGPYFAITTLGLGEAVRVIIVNIPQFNYSEGLPIAAYFRYNVFNSYIAMYITVVALFLTTLLLRRTRYGAMLEAIREDEDLAESMGVNTRKAKLAAYVLSAAAAGVIGGLTAITHVYAHPGFFSINLNVSVLASLLMGGGGTLLGPLVGASIFYFIADALLIRFPYLHLVIFGAVVMMITLAMPRGLSFILYRYPKISQRIADV
ncbi:MAG: branched-chain amino acid ABC transporter permease [Candidatus Caldarchaeum sp.]|nr:branched-chain amino acid ABC transporter permease [Candidatus Caldarchaeum sp.]MCX8200896.1 branched-chain amino acid ABC transporter permease [Candidatus Caldarchaeum sp.]MDW8063828.1 branched-chain amino acid ABC transporter permease [Candidatus Caldarchaeum sp.]MDW8435671.1 branched-chain amino acid ABC transporter permease [Candidatus Caldarchaeum sp.]